MVPSTVGNLQHSQEIEEVIAPEAMEELDNCASSATVGARQASAVAATSKDVIGSDRSAVAASFGSAPNKQAWHCSPSAQSAAASASDITPRTCGGAETASSNQAEVAILPQAYDNLMVLSNSVASTRTSTGSTGSTASKFAITGSTGSGAI